VNATKIYSAETFTSEHSPASSAYYAEAIEWVGRLLDGGLIGPATAIARLQGIERDLATALWRPSAQGRALELRALARERALKIADAGGFDPADALEISMREVAVPADPDAWCVEGCGRPRRPRPSGPGRPPSRCEDCQTEVEQRQARERSRAYRERP
jgi:hypothetical protein